MEYAYIFFSADYIFGFHTILTVNSDYFLNNTNQAIFQMETRCVFFEVRTEFLNVI